MALGPNTAGGDDHEPWLGGWVWVKADKDWEEDADSAGADLRRFELWRERVFEAWSTTFIHC